MNTTHTGKAFRYLAMAFVLLFGSSEAFAQAQAQRAQPGRVTRKDGTQITGNIRWLAQKKKYVVSQTRKDGQSISTDVPLSDVAKVETKKPEKLEAAAKAVMAGKSRAAIPVLEEIVSQYAMLQWDVPATRYLAQAKIDTGDAAGAIKLCESVIATRPEQAYLGDMAPIYWNALLKTDKKAKLDGLITKAIASGDSFASASALIMRGDVCMENKEPENALKDGYLRVVVLYEKVRQVQPEALYKGAKAFEALSQNSNAEKLRDMLRKKFPQSDYAKQL